MSEQSFKRLISGESAGLVAGCVRLTLHSLSWPYRLAVAVRNGLFDRGLKHTATFRIPVLAVGNLTTGGTGKTPVVALLVRLLQQAGHRPGIVSRGYRSAGAAGNDEKRVLQQLCPDVPHLQNPDRVAAVTELLQQSDISAVVLDDAFQHRRIGRDLNIVLIDATCPFGFGHLLPRGLLREPVSALRRADLVLLTRTDNVDQTSLQQIEATVQRANPGLQDRCFQVCFRPQNLLTAAGQQLPLAEVSGQRVLIMAAIGNPAGFVATCRQLGADIVETRFFPDHHHYSDADLQQVRDTAAALKCARVLTTLKDLVKIRQPFADIAAVQIETHFASGESEFQRLISAAAAPPSTKIA